MNIQVIVLYCTIFSKIYTFI